MPARPASACISTQVPNLLSLHVQALADATDDLDSPKSHVQLDLPLGRMDSSRIGCRDVCFRILGSQCETQGRRSSNYPTDPGSSHELLDRSRQREPRHADNKSWAADRPPIIAENSSTTELRSVIVVALPEPRTQ